MGASSILSINRACMLLVVLSTLTTVIHVDATSCVFDANNHPAGCTIVTGDIDASIPADRLQTVEILFGNIDLNSFTNFTVMRNLRRVEGSIISLNSGTLESISLPVLENVTGPITVLGCSTLQSFEMPFLRNAITIYFKDVSFGVPFPFNFPNLEFIISISFKGLHAASEANFHSLQRVIDYIDMEDMDHLTSVNFDSLTGAPFSFTIVQAPLLQTVSLPAATNLTALTMDQCGVYEVLLPELVAGGTISLTNLPSLNTTYVPKLIKSDISLGSCATSPMVLDLPQLTESTVLWIADSPITPQFGGGLHISSMLLISGYHGNINISGVVSVGDLWILNCRPAAAIIAPDLEEVRTFFTQNVGFDATEEFVLDLPKLRSISSSDPITFDAMFTLKSFVLPSLETVMSTSITFQTMSSLTEVRMPKLVNGPGVIEYHGCGSFATSSLVFEVPKIETGLDVAFYDVYNLLDFEITAKNLTSVKLVRSPAVNLTISSEHVHTIHIKSNDILKSLSMPGVKQVDEMLFVGLGADYSVNRLAMNFEDLQSVDTLRVLNVRNLRQINAPKLEEITTLLQLEDVDDFRTLGGLEGLRHVASFNLTNVFDLCEDEVTAFASTLGVTVDGTTYVVSGATGSCDLCGDGFRNYQETCDSSAGDSDCPSGCSSAEKCSDGSTDCNHGKDHQSNPGKSRAAATPGILGMNTASTAGAAVGLFLFLAIILTVVVVLTRRRHRRVTKVYGSNTVDFVKPVAASATVENATMKLSSDMNTDISTGLTTASKSGATTVPADMGGVTESIVSMRADLYDAE